MFFSLNKKILYTLGAFVLLVTIVFFIFFISLYRQKIQDNQDSIYMRNQYVVNLLYDNVAYQNQLAEISEAYPEIADKFNLHKFEEKMSAAQEELSNEQKLNAELRKNYDNNLETIKTGARMILFSLIFVLLLVVLLIFLLDYWVIQPIKKLTDISDKVSDGIFSSRIAQKYNRRFKDEFDTLYVTFNQMLDNMEHNIEEVKMRERFLQQLIDAVPDGIRVVDRDYNVIMANRAVYKLLNLSNSCIGHKCFHAYGQRCEACPQSRYNCPVAHFQQETQNTLYTIHEVGKIPLYISAAKLRYGFGENDYHIVEAIHDLSSDVRFSHQQKVSSLGFLSTSVAHEMKNNLGAIRLILEGLLENEYKDIPDDNENKKYLMMIYNQLVETVKIPERLLKLARYSETDVSEIDVGAAIKDMMQMIDYDAKRRGIIMSINVEPNLSMSGNEADFKMIILNLVQNAIKAMPDGGELRVSAEKSSRNIVINIRDSGVGIEEEKIKHIFEPFYSANEQVKSSGLGLAIVRSLVEKARGTISVKSKVGRGTRFTIRIPQNLKNHEQNM